jgi:hypothetical protein
MSRLKPRPTKHELSTGMEDIAGPARNELLGFSRDANGSAEQRARRGLRMCHASRMRNAAQRTGITLRPAALFEQCCCVRDSKNIRARKDERQSMSITSVVRRGSGRLPSSDVNFGSAPSFEVQVNRFAKIGASGFDVSPLRGHGKLRAACDVPAVFFRDQCGKAVVHAVMLAEGHGARNRRVKAGQQRHVHTQRFAFRAAQEDDESVKMSNITNGRASTFTPALLAVYPRLKRVQSTNFYSIQISPFLASPILRLTENKALKFFCSIQMKSHQPRITNHKSRVTRITTHQSPITNHGDRTWPKN